MTLHLFFVQGVIRSCGLRGLGQYVAGGMTWKIQNRWASDAALLEPSKIPLSFLKDTAPDEFSIEAAFTIHIEQTSRGWPEVTLTSITLKLVKKKRRGL